MNIEQSGEMDLKLKYSCLPMVAERFKPMEFNDTLYMAYPFYKRKNSKTPLGYITFDENWVAGIIYKKLTTKRTKRLFMDFFIMQDIIERRGNSPFEELEEPNMFEAIIKYMEEKNLQNSDIVEI